MRKHHLALLALFFALGGTSVAAVQALPRNSVGSPQIKNRSIKTIDMSRRAVKALRGQRGPRGLQGQQGTQGIQGPKGATGAKGDAGVNASTNVVSRFSDVAIAAGARGFDSVNCNAGERVVGGGASFIGGFNDADRTSYSLPTSSTGSWPGTVQGDTTRAWAASMVNGGATTRTMRVFVLCASP